MCHWGVSVWMTAIQTCLLLVWARGVTGPPLSAESVKIAAREARKAILDVAGEMLEAAVHDLVLQKDRAFVKGSPERSLTFEEIAAHAVYTGGGAPIMVKGTFVPDSEKADESLFGNISGTYAFGAQGCRVRVDCLTGEIDVLDFDASHDVGRAINPVACEGQIQGSIAQGIGYGLLEQIEYKNGVMLDPRFLDYNIPTALDMPRIHSYLVESIDPAGPFGAKGVAEPAMTPTAVCIANAVFDAVGVRIKELPITPEKILKALQNKERK